MANKNITVPDLGGASEVVVIEVLVKLGEQVKPDTAIVTLESDKATMEVPADVLGTVKELKVKVGDKIATGAVLLVVDVVGDEKVDAKVEVKSATIESPLVEKEKVDAVIPQIINDTDPITSFENIHAGPAVRRLAREFGVDLTQILGSGFKQRILKEDVQTYVKNKLSQPSASITEKGASGGISVIPMAAIDFTKFGSIETQALSRLKKLSGKNLHRNWVTIPHVTQFAEADITDLDDFRQKNKVRFEKEGVRLTPLVFIMKAIVVALRKFPTFNASLDVSGENLVLKQYFHIGVAVDTPDGLVVPVVRDVDQKRLSVLAKELATLSEKARNKQLLPNEMQGGCFTISSLGGIGGTAFTPIINAPEVAILGVSKGAFKPVYQDGVFVPRMMLPLSLSYDHRVIDGAEAARFAVYLSELLADVRNLLL